MKLFNNNGYSVVAIAFALAVTAQVFQPKEAQAGLIIIGVCDLGLCNDLEDGGPVALTGFTMSFVGGLSTFVGLATALLTNGTSGEPIVGVGASLLVLGIDGALNPGVLEGNLSARYPFIDDREVTANLASSIYAKVPLNLKSNESYFVSLSENSTREILSPIDLSEEQIQKVVNDLKP